MGLILLADGIRIPAADHVLDRSFKNIASQAEDALNDADKIHRNAPRDSDVAKLGHIVNRLGWLVKILAEETEKRVKSAK